MSAVASGQLRMTAAGDLERSVKKMASKHDDDEWTPSQDSLGRFIAFAVPLSLVAALITVVIATWKSPDDQLSGLEYATWIGLPLVAFLVFVGQNSIEGCVILIVLGIGLAIGLRFLPAHFLFPGVSALIALWLLTRIHRRLCDGKP